MSVRLRVPGKINLALRVGPRREDGFHPLATVFMALSLADEVSAQTSSDGRISCTVSGAEATAVGPEADNLAVKAAQLLRQRHGRADLGVALTIVKRLPVAGGMAGGSADAAGALLACSRLWQLPLTQSDLLELAGHLGSDVAFPLVGGCALGLGRGEQVTPVLCRGQFHWVLAQAHQGLSTAAVYQRFDQLGPASPPDPGAAAALTVPPELLTALASGNPTALAAALVNDLEPAALTLAPQLKSTMAAGLAAGALRALVSGSGPTVAFLAADASAATDIAVRLASQGLTQRLLRVYGPVAGAQFI
jgi:4-diphosphocytidyl-2-C-methyl-D-erythritol kinase